jgi:hypothetical protein
MPLPAGYESYTTTRRRYLWRKELSCARVDSPHAPVWRAQRLAESGTDLPGDIPARAQLVAGGVLAVEEITGASVPELVALGLSNTAAELVITFLES